jgi:DNA-binding GntR family transcriptional regulator
MEILEISPKTPLLVVESLAESQDGDTVEYCLTKFRGDLCSITVDFNADRE